MREDKLTNFCWNPQNWFKPEDEQVAEFVTDNWQEFLLSKADFPEGPLWAPGEFLPGVVLPVFSKAQSSVWWLVPFNLILFSKDPYDSSCRFSALHQSFLLKPGTYLSVICLKMLSPKHVLALTFNCQCQQRHFRKHLDIIRKLRFVSSFPPL